MTLVGSQVLVPLQSQILHSHSQINELVFSIEWPRPFGETYGSEELYSPMVPEPLSQTPQAISSTKTSQ